MNKLINLAENEFQKSISKMTISEKESLLRLLFRELSLEKEQLNQYKEIIKLPINQRNNSESSRYEQRLKETEISIATLERKLSICQKEIDSGKSFQRPAQVALVEKIPPKISPSIFQSGKSANINSFKTDDSFTPPISTKSLINNFEKISNPNVDASQILRPKKDVTDNVTNKTANSRLSLPTWKSNKFEDKIEENSILFTNVKLKKVGLPPDAKENESTRIVNDDKLVLQNFPNNQTQKKTLSNGTPSLAKSVSVDFGQSSSMSAKHKFHNPNKEIQVAIQNEIKELKLKKTTNNSENSVVNCSIDNMSLGRYDFINEKSMANSSITTNSISSSKSMPFLNSIVMNTNKLNEISLESTPESIIFEENVESNGNASNTFETSAIENWDPTVVLNELYDFGKLLNEIQCPTKINAKNISGYIEISPAVRVGANNLWKRRYATISNGELKIFENQSSFLALIVFEVKNIFTQQINDETLEISDSKGVCSTIRFSKSTDCLQWIDALKSQLYYQSSEIIPRLYDSITSASVPKILIVDVGSCSIRAGLLKTEPTLPKLYFPNIAAISKKSNDVVEVGFEVVNPNYCEECNVIRPLKPDTTLENIAFTSGTVEFIFKKVCTMLNIDPKEYVVMLSLPHNIAEVTRTKLADVLIFRLNFKGVSMCGQSLLALHAYGEPTGVLVDIGHRTEILPVIHGIVQRSSIMRSIYGGHLIQIALSHLLPFKLSSLTDFLLARYIMEKSCLVAENSNTAENFIEKFSIDFENFNLPPHVPKSFSICGKNRCLPVEGLFNPEIYSLDIPSLPKLIYKSIQSCPVDNRRDLYQSICLSGAGTQFPGLRNRLETELKRLVPKNCEVKINSSPNRAHFSYVGACFVALSDNFSNTVVNRREWEEARNVALKKWHL